MAFETIERTGLEQAQKALLPKKDSGLRGGTEQREFVQLAAEQPAAFCDLLRSWGLRRGKTPPVFRDRLTEREFTDPPWSTECTIAATWKDLSQSQAARPETWTRIHLELIVQGKIESWYLAANGGGDSGRTRIRRALNSGSAKEIDGCVRSVLRRLGGVIADRANRTAFLDCPIARAWWRHRYAIEAELTFKLDTAEAISAALRPSFRWSSLIEAMVSRLTVIGDSAIRPAVVQSVTDGAAGTQREMDNILDNIGQQSTVRALGALPAKHVLEIIHANRSGRGTAAAA